MPQKMIEFLNKTAETGYEPVGCMMVNGDPKDLYDPCRIVIRRPTFYIAITYPLRENAMASWFVDNRWKATTRLELFKRIASYYHKVYLSPKAYDIWGHGINDLYLEGAKLRGDTLNLFIGS